MSELYVVSFILDKSSYDILNTSFGTGLIPDIYEIKTEHKNILFLVPYNQPSSESIMRAVKTVSKHHPDVSAQCWAVYNGSIKSFFAENNIFDKFILLNDFNKSNLPCNDKTTFQKTVDLSDYTIFYIEEPDGVTYKAFKYAQKAGKAYRIFEYHN